MRQIVRVQCTADKGCPYPGPVCAMHQRMQDEPDAFASSTATKQMEVVYGIKHGELYSGESGPRMYVYKAPR